MFMIIALHIMLHGTCACVCRHEGIWSVWCYITAW